MSDIIAPAGLRFGVLFDRLATVHRIYIRAEEAMSSFRARNGLFCPPGCGVCCENFIPDMLPIEASYLAAWFVRNRPEQALRIANEGFPETSPGSGCPLYNPETPDAHCGVYAGRPLLCRLFAFAGTRDKSGRLMFSLCRHMPDLPPPNSGKRMWKGEELTRILGVPPLMSDLASELEAVAPGESERRTILTAAIPSAIRQIIFLSGFSKNGAPETDDHRPINPPVPHAS